MLIDPVFFDTDCLSSFLTTHEEDVLFELYGHRIRVPAVVRRELSPPWRPDLGDAIGSFLKSGKATLQDIDVGSEAHDLFLQLTNPSSPGVRALGKGEAACLVLARVNKGTIASNNLRDVMSLVREYHLRLATTGIILHQAVEGASSAMIRQSSCGSRWLTAAFSWAPQPMMTMSGTEATTSGKRVSGAS